MPGGTVGCIAGERPVGSAVSEEMPGKVRVAAHFPTAWRRLTFQMETGAFSSVRLVVFCTLPDPTRAGGTYSLKNLLLAR